MPWSNSVPSHLDAAGDDVKCASARGGGGTRGRAWRAHGGREGDALVRLRADEAQRERNKVWTASTEPPYISHRPFKKGGWGGGLNCVKLMATEQGVYQISQTRPTE